MSAELVKRLRDGAFKTNPDIIQAADRIEFLDRQNAELLMALQNIVGCFEAAEAEGLAQVLAETTDERLQDLVQRRLSYSATYAAEAISGANRPATANAGGQGATAMCERKTNEIMRRDGYQKVGYVLMGRPEERICVSAQGAVSWFTREQWHWLMHNRDHVEFHWPKPIGAAVRPGAVGAPSQDAGRYRWLLANYARFNCAAEALKHGNLDAAIDAAMQASAGANSPEFDGIGKASAGGQKGGA